MNIYRGCSHGCIYCDSRSDCYHIDRFDTVMAKENALAIIRDDLRRKVKKGVVVTGAMSDPYNPFEEELLLTRHALELLNAFEFGVGIATKSPLVTRDMDILSDIKEHSPVLVKLTITCAEDALAAKIEPDAPPSSARFTALETLSKQGIYSGVLLMPVMPFIADHPDNIRAIIRRAADCGARFIYPGFGVTARAGQREYMLQRLEKSFPGLSEVYRKRYGERYHCSVPHANALWKLFVEECDRYGILYEMTDIIRSYRQGYDGNQLRFF